MTTQFYSLITNYGEQVIAQAVANNTPVPLKTMAIGDGSGAPTTPNATQTKLQREVYRAEITDLLQDNATPNQVIAELLVPETVGGFTVREVGIYDDQNKLVAVANCPENYKPVLEQGSGKVQYYRIVLRVSSSDAVTLSLNNNIVYATRVEFNQFVNNLGNPDGFKMVGQCESIAQLRTIEPTEEQQRILVKSWHAGKNLGGGEFYADFGDTTTADNGGTVIVTTGGKRWRRVYQELFHTTDFGLPDELASLSKINVSDNKHRISISGKLGGVFKAESKVGLVVGTEDVLFSTQNAWVRESRNYVPHAEKNRRLYADAYRNLLNGSIRVVCVGDSMTYGYDENSADKLPPLEGHVRHRAPVNYPAQMQKELNRILGNDNSVVINYGFSGDTAQSSYQREMWQTNPNADLAIVKLGLNDRSHNVPLQTYIYYLSKWVERLLDWNTSVVIALPTMQVSGAEIGLNEAYRQAAAEVAENYGCKVIDTSYFVDNFTHGDIYSDGTHFNKHGYTILGNLMAWALLDNFKTESMSNGYLNVSRKNVWHTASMERVSNIVNNSDARVVIYKNQQVSFVFYTNNDVTEINLNGVLVGGVEVSFDSDNLRAKSYSKFAQISTTANRKLSYNLSDKHRSSLYLGRICGRGWHCVTIKSVDNATYPAYAMGLKLRAVNDDNSFYDMNSGLFATEKTHYVKYDPVFAITGALPSTTRNTEIVLPVRCVGGLMAGSRWFLSEMATVKIYATKLYEKGQPWFHSYAEYRVIPYNSRLFIEPIIEKMIAGGNVVAEDVIVKLTNITLPKRGQTGDTVFTLKRDLDCYVKIVIDNDTSTGLTGIEG